MPLSRHGYLISLWPALLVISRLPTITYKSVAYRYQIAWTPEIRQPPLPPLSKPTIFCPGNILLLAGIIYHFGY